MYIYIYICLYTYTHYNNNQQPIDEIGMKLKLRASIA